MKRRKCYIVILSILLLIVIFGVWLAAPIDNRPNLSDNRYYIAHAGGAIDGRQYTNSREAVMKAIDDGYMYIELDLHQESDSTILCMHAPEDTIGMNLTPLTLNEALDIRKKHPFVLVTDKIDAPDILDRYFADNKKNLMVETFSWEQFIVLYDRGYTPILAINKWSVLDFVRVKRKVKRNINWVESSAYSKWDILKLRILKKLFGVKIAFVPFAKLEESYYEYIGNEFDLIYVNDKSTIQKYQYCK